MRQMARPMHLSAFVGASLGIVPIQEFTHTIHLLGRLNAQAPATHGKKGDMNLETGRKYDMGTRAYKVHNVQPDTDPGTTAAAEKLNALLIRFGLVAAAQRDGIVDVRAASAAKERLRKLILSGPIAHLAEVGRAAAQEDHEVGTAFRFKPGASSFLAFQTAAGTMAANAEAHRETLVKHGLAVPVLDEFNRMLDQFGAAMRRGQDGRTAHVAATRELATIANQIARTVRVMDVRNRQRFQDNQELLGSWIAATKILGSPRATPTSTPETTTPPSAEARPAA